RMSVARWRPAYQADFAARARWLETSYAQANHPPVARLASASTVTVKPGGKVTLDASRSSDPDGDRLSYRWWVYKEVSDYFGNVRIDNATSAKATLTAPGSALSKPLNVILEVTDNGSPRLTRYQRVLVNVKK
ncbi:PKD domain-containing protein, partial [Geminicoccus harenae]